MDYRYCKKVAPNNNNRGSKLPLLYINNTFIKN